MLTDGGSVGSSGSGDLRSGQLDPRSTLPAQFASSNGTVSSYKIGANDVLKITVFQVDEMNRTIQVSGNGMITMPLIGSVMASGRTAHDVETDIARRLQARYLRSPQVTVYIDGYNSQKITVGGSVKKPGIYPVKGDMSLLQALAGAEGLDTVADPSNVVVFRNVGANRYVGRFDISQIRSGRSPDPLLQNGDVVMVDDSSFKTSLRDWSPALSALGSAANFIKLVP